MTITLTKPVRVGGVELAAATTQSLGAALEADLVARGCATYTINPILSGQGQVMSDANPSTGLIIKTIWNGSQAQYDAIAVKDVATLYVIV